MHVQRHAHCTLPHILWSQWEHRKRWVPEHMHKAQNCKERDGVGQLPRRFCYLLQGRGLGCRQRLYMGSRQTKKGESRTAPIPDWRPVMSERVQSESEQTPVDVWGAMPSAGRSCRTSRTPRDWWEQTPNEESEECGAFHFFTYLTSHSPSIFSPPRYFLSPWHFFAVEYLRSLIFFSFLSSPPLKKERKKKDEKEKKKSFRGRRAKLRGFTCVTMAQRSGLVWVCVYLCESDKPPRNSCFDVTTDLRTCFPIFTSMSGG